MKSPILNLCPPPFKHTAGEGTLSPADLDWSSLASSCPEALRPPVKNLSQMAAASAKATASEPLKIVIELNADADWVPEGRSADEAYVLTLHTEEGVRIEASTEAGAFRGLVRLQEIMRQAGAVLPALKIEDAPVYSRRGYMLDISRCKVPRMDWLYRLVDILTDLQYNEFQLYTEHTFAYHGHETVWGDASPMTGSEIEALNAYCAERFIDLVPNQNSFGHFERWLRYPEYKHLAECPDGFIYPWGSTSDWGTTLFPSDESLRFVDRLYDELLPHFTSPYLNIGGDEPWELGQGRSRAACDERGRRAVYTDFMLRLFESVHAHDRSPQFWADIVLEEDDEELPDLPHDATALIWGYDADHPYNKLCPRVAATGTRFYVCPGTSTWNTLGGRLSNMRENILNAAQNGAAHGAAGMLLTDWGDNGHHQPVPISFPGLVLAAAASWNPEQAAGMDLESMVASHAFDANGPALAEVTFALGDVRDLLSRKRPNGSPLNDLFLADADKLPWLMENITEAELEKVLETLEGIIGKADSIEASSPEASAHASELSVAARMMRLAAHRALDFLRRAQNQTATERRRELTSILGLFETNWVRRQRVGGLHESSNHIRRVLDSL